MRYFDARTGNRRGGTCEAARRTGHRWVVLVFGLSVLLASAILGCRTPVDSPADALVDSPDLNASVDDLSVNDPPPDDLSAPDFRAIVDHAIPDLTVPPLPDLRKDLVISDAGCQYTPGTVACGTAGACAKGCFICGSSFAGYCSMPLPMVEMYASWCKEIRCDGPEDCPMGERCVFDVDVAWCKGGPAPAGKDIFCHCDADCPPEFPYCSRDGGFGLSACRSK